MKQRNEANGTHNDNWETPQYILDWVKENYGDYFDPCPLNGLEDGFDGLNKVWGKINFINPPYGKSSDKDKFIERCITESDIEGNICVLLVPASTDTKIFHELIAPNSEVLFLKSRIKFKGTNSKGEYVTNKCGQTGSMICIFGNGKRGQMHTLDLNNPLQR